MPALAERNRARVIPLRIVGPLASPGRPTGRARRSSSRFAIRNRRAASRSEDSISGKAVTAAGVDFDIDMDLIFTGKGMLDAASWAGDRVRAARDTLSRADSTDTREVGEERDGQSGALSGGGFGE